MGNWSYMLQKSIFCNTLKMKECSIEQHGTNEQGRQLNLCPINEDKTSHNLYKKRSCTSKKLQFGRSVFMSIAA